MTLDPQSTGAWQHVRRQMHDVLDRCLDSMQNIDDRHAWLSVHNPVPHIRERRMDAHDVQMFALDHLDQDAGNRSPMFFGYAQGGGTVAGLMAAMIVASANANCGGRVHHAIDVEDEVVRWSLDLFGMPGGSGVLTAGTSEAHVLAMHVAPRDPVVYGSHAHASICRAIDVTDCASVRIHVATGDEDLFVRTAADYAHDHVLVLTLGTTETAYVDDVAAYLHHRDDRPRPWIHVDAAMGAHWLVDPDLRRRYQPLLDVADSVAFDFHKGFQVQYDCGVFLCRHADRHLQRFAHDAPYLRRDRGGIASDGRPWPADRGIALSRANRALPVWTTLMWYGTDAIAAWARRQDALGRLLAELLAASGTWRVVSERHGVVTFDLCRGGRDDHLRIARDLQTSGEAVVTVVGGIRTALRACIMCHRTDERHVRRLVNLLDERASTVERERDQA